METDENGVQTSLIYLEEAPKTPEDKPVYIVYPNYALPDLSFLNAVEDKYKNIALKPQGFSKKSTAWKKMGKRPFSCNDIDALKQRGFAHVKDWESLNFLLPSEYKKVFQDVPEFSKHVKSGEEVSLRHSESRHEINH